MAIVSMVVSIASIVVCGVPGIIGAILGHMSQKKIAEGPGLTGEGMALAGIIVGWIVGGFSVLAWISYVVLLIIIGANA